METMGHFSIKWWLLRWSKYFNIAPKTWTWNKQGENWGNNEKKIDIQNRSENVNLYRSVIGSVKNQ